MTRFLPVITLAVGIAAGWAMAGFTKKSPDDWVPVFSLKDCMIKGMHGQHEVMFPIVLADCREQEAARPPWQDYASPKASYTLEPADK